MNKEFRKLLLKIAALPKTDQKWMLNKLTTSQQQQFERLHGNVLLREAKRFQKLSPVNTAPEKPVIQIPSFCQELMHQEPLYIAIILEQGQFAWQEPFLKSLDQEEYIKQLLDEQVSFIKPLTKSNVLKQWQTHLSFDDQLAISNG
jgi:hypothetical protein